MNRRNTHIVRAFLLLVTLLAAGCSKMEGGWYDTENKPDQQFAYDNVLQDDLLAVATLRSRDGVRFLQLDPKSVGYVVNADAVEDVADGTRLFVQYKAYWSDNRPGFCTESVWVDWATPLEVGNVSSIKYEASSELMVSDPMDIVLDWISSLEDGFLTLHYTILASGRQKHWFGLYQSALDPTHFYLRHDAQGDTAGSLTDGIVCFPVENLLPDTGEKTVTLSLTYLNLKNTPSTLTVDYRTQK